MSDVLRDCCVSEVCECGGEWKVFVGVGGVWCPKGGGARKKRLSKNIDGRRHGINVSLKIFVVGHVATKNNLSTSIPPPPSRR